MLLYYLHCTNNILLISDHDIQIDINMLITFMSGVFSMIYHLTSFKNISGPTSNRWDFPQKVLILDQKSHGTTLEKIPRQVHIIPCQLELRTIELISTSCNNDFILSHQTPKKITLLPSQHAPLINSQNLPITISKTTLPKLHTSN